MCRANRLTTLMWRLSWNLGASNFWNPQGLSTPVKELLYLSTTYKRKWQFGGRYSDRYGLEDSEFDTQRGRDFPYKSWLARGLPSPVYITYQASFPGLKQQEIGVDHPSPARAKVLSEWAEPYLDSPCALKACYTVIFTFTYIFHRRMLPEFYIVSFVKR